MAKTTTSQLFVKPLQFVVETTEGTTPTASPSFTVCPPVKSLSIKKDGGYVDVAQIGPEDLAALVQGQQSFESQVVFYLSNTGTDEAFIGRAITAANYGTPSGTISETFTILFSYYLNGTENYVLMKGTRAKSASIKLAIGAAHEITIDYIHTSITTPNTSHGLTTPTLISAFNSGVIQHWLDGGASPVSIIGASIDCTEFNCTINRNTSPDYTIGTANPHSSQPHGRRISGDFKHLHTATTQEGNFTTPTTGTITTVLDTGNVTLTISNAALVTIGRENGADDTEATVESIGFRGLSCTFA
jgi:hypothetical protein